MERAVWSQPPPGFAGAMRVSVSNAMAAPETRSDAPASSDAKPFRTLRFFISSLPV